MGTDYHYGPPKYINRWFDVTPSELAFLNELYPYAKSGMVVDHEGTKYVRRYRSEAWSNSGKTGHMFGSWELH